MFYIEDMSRDRIRIGVVFVWKVQRILVEMTEIRLGLLIIIESVDGLLCLRQLILLLLFMSLFLL